jgi:hypothetical protein
MALENPSWGQERIANELLLKLGLEVSPRTVRKYMPSHCVGSPGKRRQTQRWSTFIRNHAKGIVACDFCVAVTATFHILYVFVVIEHASRRLLHVNVTAHSTAEWIIQQFREAIPADHGYRILIHDWDSIFSKQVDQGVRNMGLRMLKTPVRMPVANSICERVIGTASGMSGRHDPAERTPSLPGPEGLGWVLQRGPTPHVIGTGHSTAHTDVARIPTGPSTPNFNGSTGRGATGRSLVACTMSTNSWRRRREKEKEETVV